MRTVRSIARPLSDVSMMASDSGVVTRMCGGFFCIAARALAGVSPLRTSTRTRARSESMRSSSSSGLRRFFCTSLPSARSGET